MISMLAMAVCLMTSFVQDTPPAAPATPLKLTARLDKEKYTLPEEMQIEVTVENTSDKDTVETRELVYEEGSLAFSCRAEFTGGGVKEYVLSVVRPDPHVRTRLASSTILLGPKKTLSYARRFPTLAPGTYTITARLGDLTAEPVRTTVEASSAGNKLVATVTTASHGSFSFELTPQEAPANVSNFVELVRRGFYNDMLFHRVIQKNWIQAGCPYGLGIGGPGYSIKAEAAQTVKHDVGTVSMAGYEKSGYHGSQFFITLSRLPALDGKFTIIGKIVPETMQTVSSIGAVDTDKTTDRPRTDIKITNVSISVKN